TGGAAGVNGAGDGSERSHTGAASRYFRATGPHLRRAIRHAASRQQKFRGVFRLWQFWRWRGRTGPGKPKNFTSRSAVTWRSRNLQHHAREFELSNGRAGGRATAFHARCARGDGKSRGGKISRRSRRAIFGTADYRDFSG